LAGQRQVAEVGLYYYNARWYDPQIGHFTQADPIVPNIYNPMSLDKFAYTLNNPVRYTDPSGHDVGCPTSNPACLGISGYSDDPRYNAYLETVAPEQERMRKLEGEEGIPPILSVADTYWSGLPPKASLNDLSKGPKIEQWTPPSTWDLDPTHSDYTVSTMAYICFLPSKDGGKR
jgi:RHS repeat-associated protein